MKRHGNLYEKLTTEATGATFCHNLLGGNWIQTSYNTNGGVNSRGGKAIKKNYAGIGYTYDKERDAFIPSKPYGSWVLEEFACLYKAPIKMPEDGKVYTWDETSKEWTEQPINP